MCVIATVGRNVGRMTQLSWSCPHGLKSPSALHGRAPRWHFFPFLWCLASKLEVGWEPRHYYEQRGCSQNGDAQTNPDTCYHQQKCHPASCPAPDTRSCLLPCTRSFCWVPEDNTSHSIHREWSCQRTGTVFQGLSSLNELHSARCNKGEAAGSLGSRQERTNHLTRHLDGFCQFRTPKVCLVFFKTKKILFLLLALLKSGKSFSGTASGLCAAQDSLPMRFQWVFTSSLLPTWEVFSFPLLPCWKCLLLVSSPQCRSQMNSQADQENGPARINFSFLKG